MGRGVVKCRHMNFPALEYLSGRQLWHIMTLLPLSGILQFQKAHNVEVHFVRHASSFDPMMLPEIDGISFHCNSHIDRSHQVVWHSFSSRLFSLMLTKATASRHNNVVLRKMFLSGALFFFSAFSLVKSFIIGKHVSLLFKI